MRVLSTLVSVLAVGVMCAAAAAQDAPPRRGGGAGGEGAPPAQRPGSGGAVRGGQLAPEKAKAAWELQARHLAQDLGLNDEQTKNIVAAYVDVREKHAESMRQLMEKMREGRGSDADENPQARRDELQKAFGDLNTADREKLQAELAKSLNADQVSKAMVPLGSFSANWDMMVSTVSGFNLDQEKNKKAMDLMQSFVTMVTKIGEETEPEARRDANQQARTKLSDEMKAILTEDQFGQFQRTLGGGRGGALRRPGADGEPGARPGGSTPRGGRGGDGTGTGGGRGGRGGGTPNPGGTPR
jgi:hypothetical protein